MLYYISLTYQYPSPLKRSNHTIIKKKKKKKKNKRIKKACATPPTA